MFTVKIKSGLGNQMFQYAFAKAASIRLGIPFQLDIQGYAHQSSKDTPRQYQLDCFNISAPLAPKSFKPPHIFLHNIIQKVKNKVYPHRSYAFSPKEQSNIKDGSYVEGYWQSEKYFLDTKDIIQKEFTLKNPLGPSAKTYKDIIESKKASGVIIISLNVRRGDYVTNPYTSKYHGALPKEFYETAIAHIKEKLPGTNLHILADSDEIDWVKEHVVTGIPTTYIDSLDIQNFEKIYILSLCDHHVVANSSFSWWAAWLNPSPTKIVVAPKKWVRDPKANTQDATPSTWIRI